MQGSWVWRGIFTTERPFARLRTTQRRHKGHKDSDGKGIFVLILGEIESGTTIFPSSAAAVQDPVPAPVALSVWAVLVGYEGA